MNHKGRTSNSGYFFTILRRYPQTVIRIRFKSAPCIGIRLRNEDPDPATKRNLSQNLIIWRTWFYLHTLYNICEYKLFKKMYPKWAVLIILITDTVVQSVHNRYLQWYFWLDLDPDPHSSNVDRKTAYSTRIQFTVAGVVSNANGSSKWYWKKIVITSKP